MGGGAFIALGFFLIAAIAGGIIFVLKPVALFGAKTTPIVTAEPVGDNGEDAASPPTIRPADDPSSTVITPPPTVAPWKGVGYRKRGSEATSEIDGIDCQGIAAHGVWCDDLRGPESEMCKEVCNGRKRKLIEQCESGCIIAGRVGAEMAPCANECMESGAGGLAIEACRQGQSFAGMDPAPEDCLP